MMRFWFQCLDFFVVVFLSLLCFPFSFGMFSGYTLHIDARKLYFQLVFQTLFHFQITQILVTRVSVNMWQQRIALYFTCYKDFILTFWQNIQLPSQYWNNSTDHFNLKNNFKNSATIQDKVAGCCCCSISIEINWPSNDTFADII